MKTRPIRILVTGAGAPGIRGTLYALRNNPDGTPIHIVGTDAKPDAVGRFMVERFYPVPEAENPNYTEVLLDICRKEAIDIVLPQTTREIEVLSGTKLNFAALGVSVMVSDQHSIEVANDKWRLLEFCKSLNIPMPSYRMARSEEQLVAAALALGYPTHPVVVKPPRSNGMRGLRILRECAWDVRRFLMEKPSGTDITLEELLGILRRGESWTDLLVTEYLGGAEYSVDAFIGQHVLVAIPRIRKAIRSGITFESVLEYREDLAEYTLKAGSRIGLQYAFGFQFKLDESGTPKVLECNPRVQGTMVASLFSGVNVIWMGVRELMGQPCRVLPGQLKPAAFYRFWGGLGVQEDATNEI